MDSLSRANFIEEHIFGKGARVVESAMEVGGNVAQREYITDVTNYKVIITIFIILYFIWIGRSLANISGSSFKVSNPFAKLSKSEGLVKSVKVGDIILDWALVVVLCALFTTRIVELLQPYHIDMAGLAQHISNMGVWAWMLLVSGLFLSLVVWSSVVVMVSCFFMRRESMIQQFFTLKSRMLKMTVVWLLPVVLLSSLEQKNLFMSYLAIIVALIFILIYLFRSYLLFASQKISILHWILYLCTVEIFPLTLLWAFFVR